MNLFRSEEHARNWHGFAAEAEAGLRPLGKMMELFSGDLFRARAEDDYISRLPERGKQLALHAQQVMDGSPFWKRDA